MKLNTFADRMVRYYLTGNCFTLKSKPGRGKTSVIKTAPAVIGAALGKSIGYVYLSAPTMTPADAIGYLIPGKDAAGNAASMFTRPNWWYTREGIPLEKFDGGVIFVDEEDKADVDVKKIIGEMGLTGICGPHQLPPGWVVWMAGNFRSDRSGSTRELDHLINRRCEIEVTDDLEGWIEWATKAGLPGLAIAFAERNPQVVFDSDAPTVQGPWPTPRSFVECIEHLSVFADADGRLPCDNAAQEDAKGYIGTAAAAQLMSFIRLEHELPSLADILANPMGCKLADRPDAQYLIARSLAMRAKLDWMPPMIAYCDRMPTEFSVLFMDTASKRDSSVINCTEADAWIQRNGSLISNISRLNKK